MTATDLCVCVCACMCVCVCVCVCMHAYVCVCVCVWGGGGGGGGVVEVHHNPVICACIDELTHLGGTVSCCMCNFCSFGTSQTGLSYQHQLPGGREGQHYTPEVCAWYSNHHTRTHTHTHTHTLYLSTLSLTSPPLIGSWIPCSVAPSPAPSHPIRRII